MCAHSQRGCADGRKEKCELCARPQRRCNEVGGRHAGCGSARAFEVTGPGGSAVSEGHFSDGFSPTREPAVLRLLPGEKFTSNVSLVATVPREKRHPGRYVVQAAYRFQGRRILAELLTIELTSGA
jgi:hypothetical protein